MSDGLIVIKAPDAGDLKGNSLPHLSFINPRFANIELGRVFCVKGMRLHSSPTLTPCPVHSPESSKSSDK